MCLLAEDCGLIAVCNHHHQILRLLTVLSGLLPDQQADCTDGSKHLLLPELQSMCQGCVP